MPNQRVIIAVPIHRKLGSGGRRIRDMPSQCQLWQPDTPLHASKMKVTSIVTRYSSILPFFTLAFSSITCRPVIPRSVLFARSRPSWTAASKLVGEAAVIFDTLATAILASLMGLAAEQAADTALCRLTSPLPTRPSDRWHGGLRE